MTMPLVADLVVSFFLVITIYYAAKLSRRLSALRADKAELQALVQNLTQASRAAEAGIKALKDTADDSGRELQKKLQDAQALREDLAYMIDRGGGVADRMETSLRTRREEPRPQPQPPRPRPVETPRPAAETSPQQDARTRAPTNFIQEMAARLAPSASGGPSRSERDLLRALAGRR